MATSKGNREVKGNTEEHSVKGTIFSVGIVGVVILLTYVVLYGLYMIRV